MTYLFRGDDRLLSPCHKAPQDVALGPLVVNPHNAADWTQQIDHLCSECGARFDPQQGLPGTGAMWRARRTARTLPEAT